MDIHQPIKQKKMMKNVICLFIVCVFVSNIAKAQGKKVARELKEYINSPAEYSSDEIDESPGVKIRPRVDTIRKDKTYSIGGQQVDEMNSVIYKAFKIHPEWKQVIAVTDWTASMYTYLGQLMRWHKQNMEKKLLAEIVLFNDGDDIKKPQTPKVIGNTGGIYFADPNDMDDFLKKVETAVDNGGGGDAEENDIEAIIAAQTKFPDADYFILIADNTEIRDISLIDRVNKPVHVIMCNGGWIIDYVKLAYKTGGTITTISDDLDFSDQSKIDANNIVLNGLKYRLKKED